jgi:cytochrome c oxidase subunit 3
MSERRRLTSVLLSALGLILGFVVGRGRIVEIAPQPVGLAGLPDQEKTRGTALQDLQLGREGTGGFVTGFPPASEEPAAARQVEFQYADEAHQTETALTGMWLFLATEVLFFGGLFLLYAIYRARHPEAMAEASRHSQLAIGTVNTVILLSSSAVFVFGLGRARLGRSRPLFWACVVTACLGVAFLVLKGYEWKLDFDDHLFPNADFAIHGANAGPAKLFWSFYFIATGLHGLHMIGGVILVGWIVLGARANRYDARYYTPVEIVGLYWSFVDMVWLLLYPSIYLVAVRP